jgi:hypothetical protein
VKQVGVRGPRWGAEGGCEDRTRMRMSFELGEHQIRS